MKLAASYFPVTELLVLVGTGVAMGLPGQRAGMNNTGPHGLSEVLYAFTSASNNNGSAFAGLSANTTWFNTALGLAMVFGQVPADDPGAGAGRFAGPPRSYAGVAGHPAHSPSAVRRPGRRGDGRLCALTFLPALALGPLAEGIH